MTNQESKNHYFPKMTSRQYLMDINHKQASIPTPQEAIPTQTITDRKNRKTAGGEQRVFCVGGGKGNKKARFVWSGLFCFYLRGEDCAGVLFCLMSAWSTSTPFSSTSSRPARTRIRKLFVYRLRRLLSQQMQPSAKKKYSQNGNYPVFKVVKGFCSHDF